MRPRWLVSICWLSRKHTLSQENLPSGPSWASQILLGTSGEPEYQDTGYRSLGQGAEPESLGWLAYQCARPPKSGFVQSCTCTSGRLCQPHTGHMLPSPVLLCGDDGIVEGTGLGSSTTAM